MTDYNFQNPNSPLLTSTPGTSPVPSVGQYEIFDYPGRYMQHDGGEGVSRRLMAGHEAVH